VETLQRIVEEGAAGGISRLIAYLGLAAVGLLVVYGATAFVRRRLRRAFRPLTHPIATAASGAASIGKAVRTTIVNRALPAASSALGAASKQVVPTLKVAGATVTNVAMAGAGAAATALQTATPLAKDAASRAAGIAQAGSVLVVDGAHRLAPVLQEVASSAAGTAKASLNLAAETAIASAPHIRQAAGGFADAAAVAGKNVLARAWPQRLETAPAQMEQPDTVVEMADDQRTGIAQEKIS
jgi:hypothetical protein